MGKRRRLYYDANGNLIKTILPNGVITDYSMDVMNRVVGLVLRQGGKFS